MPLQLTSHFIIVKGDKVSVTVYVTSWQPDPSPRYNIGPGLIQARLLPSPGPGLALRQELCSGPGIIRGSWLRICDICPVICNYFNLVTILQSISFPSLLCCPPLPQYSAWLTWYWWGFVTTKLNRATFILQRINSKELFKRKTVIVKLTFVSLLTDCLEKLMFHF